MSRKQFITLCGLSFKLPHKLCFEDFHAVVHDGDRIVIIGDNGSGKSSLMKIFAGEDQSSSGKIQLADGLRFGYLPQDFDEAEDSTVWEIATSPVHREIQALKELDKLDPEKEAAAYASLLEDLVSKDAFSLESYIKIVLDRMQLSEKKDRAYGTLSGGERMRLKIAKLLTVNPDLILLDEPTNHLDHSTRKWLSEFIHSWKGAAIIISHDYDLLSSWPKKVWSIENGEVITFDGSYHDYVHHKEIERKKKEVYRQELIQKKKVLVRKGQAEQTRQVRTKKQGKKKYNGDPLLAKGQAERAENTMGKAHIKRNSEERERINEELRELNERRKVVPRFYTDKRPTYHFYLKIENGVASYGDHTIFDQVNFTLQTGQKVAINGANGSGKTTLMKAIMGSSEVTTRGDWDIPSSFMDNVGYLDQYHKELIGEQTVLQHILATRPDWTEEQFKSHLHAFLFYDRRTWQQPVNTLSEGEKMRLSLALIAADSPGVLFLDEVSNHLDLTTKEHLIEVLKNYQGALLVNSHEKGFLDQLSIDVTYQAEDWKAST